MRNEHGHSDLQITYHYRSDEGSICLLSEASVSHTDHLGSILSVTDENGNTVAEQNFDPWGRYRDPGDWSHDDMLNNGNPAWLSRGYTGHEHHPRFGLINMNNRMYDPVIGRMLAPDNYVQDATFTQNYNRYSYAYNNPLVYTDPDGNIIIHMLVGGAINLGLQSLMGNVDSWADAGIAFGQGALSGAIGGFAGATIGEVAVGGFNAIMPTANIPITDNLTVGLSPGVFLGSNSLGIGANVSATYNTGNWAFSVGTSVREYRQGNAGGGFEASLSGGAGWHDGTYGASFHLTRFYSGETSQTTGMAGVHYNDFSLMVDNDFMGDGGDRFRTASVHARYKDFSVGFNLFTGDPGLDEKHRVERNDIYVENELGNDPNKYRFGGFFVGYGQYRAGVNSERGRAAVQNGFHAILRTMGSESYDFKQLDMPTSPYYSVGQHYNSYSLW